MKDKKDRTIRAVEIDTWRDLKLLSVKLGLTIAETLKYLIKKEVL